MTVELWAEAGPCDNSIAIALKYAEAAHAAGASALKVQWYNADTLVIPTASRYDHTGGRETTQYEMFRHSIYPYQRWEPVIERCRDLGIEFIPSVFDFEGIEVANHYELGLLKIASGELTHHELLKAASEGRRVAVSTGASELTEVKDALESLWYTPGMSHILMACHLEYPTPFHRANIARTFSLQLFFPDFIPGFSDHTPGVETIPLIIASGCQVIEKHFTLEQGKGHDSDFALSPEELEMAVHKIQGTLAVMGNSDVEVDVSEIEARNGARRSPYPVKDLAAGATIREGDLMCLRPFYGIDPNEMSRYYGNSYDFAIPKHGQLPSLPA